MSRTTQIGVSKQIGIASVLVAVVALGFANLISNAEHEQGGAPEFALMVALCGGVALWLFGRVIPRAAEAGENPARTGMLTSAVGLLSVVVFWTGLPFVLGAGGAVLGAMGRERGTQRVLATAALVVGVLAVLGGIGAAIGDELAA
jgi:hypothetical protein